MEKNILLVVDGVPKLNFTVSKLNTIKNIKDILKTVIDKEIQKITFFVNETNEVPVFDTNKFDGLTLESVWDSMNKPQISIATKYPKQDRISQILALTGIKDVDYMIMQNLNDQDLGNFCKVNKEARKLCRDDTFWRKRTLNRFHILGDEFLQLNKESNFKSWRDYYISLVDFLEKNSGESEQHSINHKYLGFFKEADFGTLSDKVSINVVIKPLIESEIFDKWVISELLELYMIKNNLIVNRRGEMRYKTDNLMDKYFSDIFTYIKGRYRDPTRFNKNNLSQDDIILISQEMLDKYKVKNDENIYILLNQLQRLLERKIEQSL